MIKGPEWGCLKAAVVPTGPPVEQVWLHCKLCVHREVREVLMQDKEQHW